MVNLFTTLYSRINNQNKWLEKTRINTLRRVLVRTLANICLPIYFALTRKNTQYRLSDLNSRTPKCMVSLTSYPARIHRVWLVVETLLHQSWKADCIVLWLSKDQFPSLDVLPKRLLRLQERGLQIELRDGDLKSHKKYYYPLMEYKDCILVTADDDIFYNSHILAQTWQLHEQHPKAIIANYTHEVLFNHTHPLPYYQWRHNVDSGENLFFGSGGITLFPCGCLHTDVTNIELALRLCPTADDVWLNTMARKYGTPIIPTPHHDEYLPVINWKTSHLADENMINQNDVQINNVINYYHEQT